MAKQKTFSRVLNYIKPYWGSIVLNLVFNLITIFFSLFSFALVGPFLTLLFKEGAVEVVAKPEFSFTSDYLMGPTTTTRCRRAGWKFCCRCWAAARWP